VNKRWGKDNHKATRLMNEVDQGLELNSELRFNQGGNLIIGAGFFFVSQVTYSSKIHNSAGWHPSHKPAKSQSGADNARPLRAVGSTSRKPDSYQSFKRIFYAAVIGACLRIARLINIKKNQNRSRAWMEFIR
jgi:hypothetical protein